jgi:DNA polymerase I
MPYFYFLPVSDPDSKRKELIADKKHFPYIANVSLENRKLLGKEKAVLRVECLQSTNVSTYAKALPKVLGGASYDDLRFPARCILDLGLATSGWNECEVQPVATESVTVEKAFMASNCPVSVVSASSPSLRIFAFVLLRVGHKGSAKPEVDPIRAVAVATNSGDAFIFSTSEGGDSQLLSSFAQAIDDFDPDLIVGYDTNKTQWSYLMARARVNKQKLALGRDRSEPHTSLFGHVSVAGRINFDLADLAAGIAEIKIKDLKNLSLHFKVPSAAKLAARDEWETFALWADQSGRFQLLEDAKISAQACLEVVQETIGFPIQLSAITGLPLDQVMAAPAGFRVDSYLLKTASRVGELIPAKNEQPFLTYRGALVQEPKTGLHSNVAVLDFAFMYPNLMKQYNLSPDTLVGAGDEAPPESVNVIQEVGHRFLKEPDGFYTIALATLIKERARIKDELAFAPSELAARLLRARERAVKMITNACYGYAGWAGARWYVREVAESAAALGRQLITETIDRANKLGLEVIYSDTDSIFIPNLQPRVDELTQWVKATRGLDIRIEQEYDRVLFTEAMKRYAGLHKDGTVDIVGLEVIRGDWSEIARKVQESVLHSLLKLEPTEKAIELVREVIRRVRKGEVPMSDFIIRKTLTKPIEKYRVRTPHAEVARKLAEEGWHVTVGDRVAYVIVKGKGALFRKARPYHAAKLEDLDLEYYVENQIKPTAMRLLERFGVNEQQLHV